jgi:hypothetical protein
VVSVGCACLAGAARSRRQAARSRRQQRECLANGNSFRNLSISECPCRRPPAPVFGRMRRTHSGPQPRSLTHRPARVRSPSGPSPYAGRLQCRHDRADPGPAPSAVHNRAACRLRRWRALANGLRAPAMPRPSSMLGRNRVAGASNRAAPALPSRRLRRRPHPAKAAKPAGCAGWRRGR